MCPSPKISTPCPHEARQPPSHCSGKEIQAGRQASPKATSRLHLCQLGPPLPGSLRGRGRGQRGGARSCRHPPGPVGTRGGMFLPLPGPPSACRPAHPGMAECKPGAGAGEGGALSLRRQQKTPTSMTTGPVSFCGSKGGSSTCKPGAQYTSRNLGDPPRGGLLGSPPPLAWPDLRLEHILR